MDPLSPVFALSVFVVAFLTARVIRMRVPDLALTGRFETIDSLRGFLALSVFIHHCAVWHQYLHTGNWEAPKTNLFNQLGQTGVALFFMITSFLFVTKLLNAGQTYDWRKFFIGRIFRLAPMYLLSVLILFLLVLIASQGRIVVGPMEVLTSGIHWALFTIFDYPLFNGFDFTRHVNAGVVWSLPYEWLFYFALPLIAWAMKKQVKPVYLAVAILFIALFEKFHGIVWYHMGAFAGGAIAAFLFRSNNISAILRHWVFGLLALVLLLSIGMFHTANNVYCLLLITALFCIVAMGNSLFGLLKDKTWQFLGEVCYSTYLIHGFFLFVCFDLILSKEYSVSLAADTYTWIAIGLTPFIVLMSYVGYKYIEKPGIDKGKEIAGKV